MTRLMLLCLSLSLLCGACRERGGEVEFEASGKGPEEFALEYCEGSRGGIFPFLNVERLRGLLMFRDRFVADWIGMRVQGSYDDVFSYGRAKGFDDVLAEETKCDFFEVIEHGLCKEYRFFQRYPKISQSKSVLWEGGSIVADLGYEEGLVNVSVCYRGGRWWVDAHLGERYFLSLVRDQIVGYIESGMHEQQWERVSGLVGVLCEGRYGDSVKEKCASYRLALKDIVWGQEANSLVDYSVVEVRALSLGLGDVYDVAEISLEIKGERAVREVIFEEGGDRCVLKESEDLMEGSGVLSVDESELGRRLRGYCILVSGKGLREGYRLVGIKFQV